MSDDLVKRLERVRQEYGAGLVSVEGSGVLASVQNRIEELQAENERLQNLIEAARKVVLVYQRDDEPKGCKCSLCELHRAADRAALASTTDTED